MTSVLRPAQLLEDAPLALIEHVERLRQCLAAVFELVMLGQRDEIRDRQAVAAIASGDLGDEA
jgi:hypothetical protein